MKRTKIAILGAGAVGSTTAYALIMKNIPSEILIIDIDTAHCQGEVLDLADALPFSKTPSVRSALPHEAQNADIIIITAGARQNPGQMRTELLATNKQVISSILESIGSFKQDAIVIMVTNPVDILVRYAQEKLSLPFSQVMGSGTLLDSLRIRQLIAQHIQIAESSVHVDILGEHGDSQFPAWSSAHIDGIKLLEFPGITQEFLDACAQKAREKAYEIIACKGATFYGVASCVTALCETIIFDQKRVLPVSCYIQELDVCLSVPAVLGSNGIERIVIPPLNDSEKKALTVSARTLKDLYKNCP